MKNLFVMVMVFGSILFLASELDSTDEPDPAYKSLIMQAPLKNGGHVDFTNSECSGPLQGMSLYFLADKYGDYYDWGCWRWKDKEHVEGRSMSGKYWHADKKWIKFLVS